MAILLAPSFDVASVDLHHLPEEDPQQNEFQDTSPEMMPIAPDVQGPGGSREKPGDKFIILKTVLWSCICLADVGSDSPSRFLPNTVMTCTW